MAVKTKEEILSALQEKFANDNSDETLSFIEDISDTYDSMEKEIKDSGEWKSKFEQNDKEWREKYKERFFSKPVDEPENLDEPETEPEKNKPKTFGELFIFK